METMIKAYDSKPDYLDKALSHLARLDDSKAVLDEILNLEPFDESKGGRISKLLSAALDIQDRAIPEARICVFAMCEETNKRNRETDTDVKTVARSLQSDFDELTDRLQEARILLASVCTNYFESGEDSITPAVLYHTYRDFSSNVRLANGLLFDLEKDCRAFHDRMYCDLFPEEKPSPETQRVEICKIIDGMSDTQLDRALAAIQEATHNG